MNNFLIISLPRSRTAWLSVALTYRQSYCLHEPLLGCKSVTELLPKFMHCYEDHQVAAVGGADTGAILFLDAIISKIPDIKVLVVQRDIEEAEASMEDMGFEDIDLTIPQNALTEASQRGNVKVIDYNKLSDPETGAEIWQHCVGTTGFNAARWIELSRLNIQVETKQFFQRLDYHQHSMALLEEEISCG